jgi:poly-gamma-glutamate synthesis protein (capsule biosynthesis protein)
MKKEDSILFLGDVAPYRPYGFSSECKTVINLECPIVRNGVRSRGKIILGARENHLKSIFGSSLLCVNLGNNHMLDYGKSGLDSTIGELEKSGIKYFGLNNIDDNNPLVISFNNLKIALISAVCETTSPILEIDDISYLSPLKPEVIAGKIQAVKKLVDRVILYVHWGAEESSRPVRRDILTARSLTDAGADIIIGSHAHAPQPVEKYKNGIIAYNLGNFIMPEMKNIPSYFDENGIPGSFFTSRMMLWNRISWGIMVDMTTLEFRIRKFMFTRKRVVELLFTPLDRFIRMSGELPDDAYEIRFERHQRWREFQCRLSEFVFHPHIPQKLKIKP